MVSILYQTKLYSDDEVKDLYANAIKKKDLRAIDQGFVDYISNKANLRVSRKCYASVYVTCDKNITVHYSAHKKVEETTGYTVTRRVDAMNLVDYKVDENTKKVTYTDSNNYSKKFYNVSGVVTECVDNNFLFSGGTNATEGYSEARHEAYAGVTPWTSIELRYRLESSSGCSSEVSECRSDILASAKETGYTLDSCELKSATVSNIDIEGVHYFVKYFIEIVYKGVNYSCEFGAHGESLGYATCPESEQLRETVHKEIKRAKGIKAKAKSLTIPTSIFNMVGIIMSFLVMFKNGFGEALGMVVATLVFNIWYWFWLGGKFAEVNEVIANLKKNLQQRVFVDGVYIPEIMSKTLVVSSVLVTFWNVMMIMANFGYY